METFRPALCMATLLVAASCSKPPASTPAEAGGEQRGETASSPHPERHPDWAAAAVDAIYIDTEGMRGCEGGWTDHAREFWSTVYTSVSRCVENARAEGSQVEGKLVFHSTLEKGGGASEFAVMEDSVGNEDLVKCIQVAAFTTEYPEADPETPCVQFVHPMEF